MNDEHAIIIGIARTVGTKADGTLKMIIEVEPTDRNMAMQLFGDPCTPIVLTAINENSLKNYDLKSKAEYGEQAKALKLSSFFRNPKVWEAVGSDENYCTWLRCQKCANCKSSPVVVAHVRRIANGAGIGKKPEYSAIPLCDDCHTDQHSHGESALNIDMDKERIKYLQDWCWEELKTQLGFASWAEVPPTKLFCWATYHKIEKYSLKLFFIRFYIH